MKYRKIGDSELEVSEISLGSWLTYGVGVEAEKARACLDRAFEGGVNFIGTAKIYGGGAAGAGQARACLVRAFEVGINFIDTSNIYGRGAAETFLGEALSGRPRDSYILATKLFFPM